MPEKTLTYYIMYALVVAVWLIGMYLATTNAEVLTYRLRAIRTRIEDWIKGDRSP